MNCEHCGVGLGQMHDMSCSELSHEAKVARVCVIQGPGRGECWGCPVRTCVLWQDPGHATSAETAEVATRAARKLASRNKVIQPWSQMAQDDEDETVLDLAVALLDPSTQVALRVGMAAEAVIQETSREAVVKRQRQALDRFYKGLRGRSLTDEDDAELDRVLERAAAEAVAAEYDVEADAVLAQLAFFRDRRIVRRSDA